MIEMLALILFLIIIGCVVAALVYECEAKDAAKHRAYAERRVQELTAEIDGLKITHDSLVREVAEAKCLLSE